MGIDNFGKNYFLEKIIKLENYLKDLVDNGYKIGIFFDATLIRLTYGTDLSQWIKKFQIFFENNNETHKIFIVEDNINFRSYGKICQSIHRNIPNFKFHQTPFDKNSNSIVIHTKCDDLMKKVMEKLGF